MNQQGTANAKSRIEIPQDILKFSNDLALYLTQLLSENSKVFSELSPDEKVEQVLIASDFVLKPVGNYVMVDANKTMRELLLGK